MITPLTNMLAHMRWADGLVLDALRAAVDPPIRAVEIYSHILGAESVWLARLRGEPPAVPVWPTLDLDSANRLARRTGDGLEAFIGALTKPELEREVVYTTSTGHEFRSRVEDILVHVMLHGSYHRGQIALLLRNASAEPAPTDFISFVRGVPAAPRTS